MKKAAITFLIVFLMLIVGSPMIIYWWGIASVDIDPTPSSAKLSPEQEKQIWLKARESGEPRIKGINPYSYIFYFKCNIDHGVYAEICTEKYPGINVSAFAIRQQVANGMQGKSTSWTISWVAYTIWVTQNWDIHQILSTMHSSRGT